MPVNTTIVAVTWRWGMELVRLAVMEREREREREEEREEKREREIIESFILFI